MGGRLSNDLDALLARRAEGIELAKIARLLQRPLDWCERQVELKARADAAAAEQARQAAAKRQADLAAWQDLGRKGREAAVDRRRAESAIDAPGYDAGGAIAEGAGRVTRTFLQSSGRFGADVELAGGRTVFVDCGAIRPELGALITPIRAEGGWTWNGGGDG